MEDRDRSPDVSDDDTAEEEPTEITLEVDDSTLGADSEITPEE